MFYFICFSLSSSLLYSRLPHSVEYWKYDVKIVENVCMSFVFIRKVYNLIDLYLVRMLSILYTIPFYRIVTFRFQRFRNWESILFISVFLGLRFMNICAWLLFFLHRTCSCSGDVETYIHRTSKTAIWLLLLRQINRFEEENSIYKLITEVWSVIFLKWKCNGIQATTYLWKWI